MGTSAPSVLITGASAGIGEALARVYAQQGARIALCARRLDRLEGIAQRCRGTWPSAQVLPLVCDVTRPQDLEQAVKETVAAFGSLDIVVANAGYGVAGRVERLDISDFRNQFETNVYGVLNTFKAACSELKKSKGCFAIVGSVNSYIALPKLSPYSMSKFAVRALAESLHGEMKKHGVAVTLICPGYVESDIRKTNNEGIYDAEKPETIPSWLLFPRDKAARQMARAIHKRKREQIITGHGKVLVFLQRHVPFLIRFLLRKRS